MQYGYIPANRNGYAFYPHIPSLDLSKQKFLFVSLSPEKIQFERTLTGAFSEALKQGVSICCLCDPSYREKDRGFVTRNFFNFKLGQFQGVTIFGSHFNTEFSNEELKTTINNILPSAPFLSFYTSLLGISAVGVDNKEGISSLVHHFVQYHRVEQIAFLIFRPNGKQLIEWEDRYNYFLESLQSLHFPENKISLIVINNRKEIKQEIERFVSNRKEKNIGIICQDDNFSYGVGIALSELNVDIGTKIKLAGYSDFDPDINKFELPLTSCVMPVEEIGKYAITELMAASLENRKGKGKKFPCPPVFRESCGCFSGEGSSIGLTMAQGTRIEEQSAPVPPKESEDVTQASRFANHILKERYRSSSMPKSYAQLKNFLASTLGKEDLISTAYLAGKMEQRFVLSNRERLYELDQNFNLYINGVQKSVNREDMFTELKRALDYLKAERLTLFLFEKEILLNIGSVDSRNVLGKVVFNYQNGKTNFEPQLPQPINWQTALDLFTNEEKTSICFSLKAHGELIGMVMFVIDSSLVNFCNVLGRNIAITLHRFRLEELQRETIRKLNEATVQLELYSKKMKTLSVTDELTKLLNRRGFLDKGKDLLDYTKRLEYNVSVFFIDLDYLKQINDNFGHSEGDSAIKIVALAMKETFRENDLIARFGGDEFVVLAVDKDAPNIMEIKNRLTDKLHKMSNSNGASYRISASIGYKSIKANEVISLEELLSAADSLLYEAKKSRKPFV